MIIQNATTANELLANGGLNPSFFGITSTAGTSTKVLVTPDPVKQTVTVFPPPVVKDGVMVTFPSYTTDVYVQPPPTEVLITSGTTLVNSYDSVGIINPGGQIRLCALVRPNVIAAAHHYNNAPFAPYIGLKVAFGGEVAIISKVIFTKDDFECYQLDRNILGVKPAAIAPLESADKYVSREVVAFGLGSLTRPIAGKTLLKYAFASGAGWVATASNKSTAPVVVQAGDSGSPVFIVVNGVPKYFGSMASVNLTEIRINMAPPWVADIAAF